MLATIDLSVLSQLFLLFGGVYRNKVCLRVFSRKTNSISQDIYITHIYFSVQMK